MTWREGFLRLATDKALVGEMYRVFFVIMAHMDKDYFSPLVPAEIVKILSISKQAVNRSVNRLVESGVVERHYVSGKLVGFNVTIFGKESPPPD